MAFHVPEKFRIKNGSLGSTKSAGNNGAFFVHSLRFPVMKAIASDGGGWEHVSITLTTAKRCPTWEEMCYIKKLFWDEQDVVMQLHVSKEKHINNHPWCLHLWRPVDTEIPLPPPEFV